MSHPLRYVCVIVLVALVAAGCGDSSQDQAKAAAANARKQLEKLSADATKQIDEASKRAGSALDKSSSAPKRHEFKTVDATVRFVNTYADAGASTPIDIYFGQGDTGKKAVTLGFGKVSDPIPVQVETDPTLTPADGSTEMAFSAYLPDQTDMTGRLLATTEKYVKGMTFTVIYTWGDATGSTGHTSTGSTVVYDSKTQTPPDGKAYVFKNENGISGIADGKYITLAPAGSCTWTTGADSDAGNVNGGTPYIVDPGQITVQVSEENTDCGAAVTSVDMSIAAGDNWLVVMYGTNKADRTALPLKLMAS